MTLQAPYGRDDFLFDLSRWNRAGLTRFQYVDGDSAVWLEELRIAMLGLYLRGIDPDDRVPEKWRNLFLKAKADRQLQISEAEFAAAVTWKDLLTAFPVEVETGGKRNQRLLEQYDRQSPDYAWEIMRAFARAAHIVLGHQDAYSNEGYLRTATQWGNLRKLAAMVNYQPTPPASATSTVALELEPDKGVIEVGRGLAMKFAPPEGGAPLIFETLKPFLAHPELNVARTKAWDHNSDSLSFNAKTKTTWIVPETAELTEGDLVVVTRSGTIGEAASLNEVERDLEAGQANLKFDPPPTFTEETGKIILLTEPDGVQLGLPRTSGNRVVIKIDNADSYSAGAIVEVSYTDNGQQTRQAVVVEGAKGLLTLEVKDLFSGDVSVEAFTPYATGSLDVLETPTDIKTLYYKSTSGTDVPVVSKTSATTRTTGAGEVIAQTHTRPDDVSGLAYAASSGRSDTGKVVIAPTVGSGSSEQTVRFEGAPPKSLKQGAWYVARLEGSSVPTALMVSTIRVEADVYYIGFDKEPLDDHDKTEFFGPMTRTLHPVDYNRDQDDAIVGGVAYLKGLSIEAQNLVKVGRDIIVVYEKDGDRLLAALANLTSVEPHDTGNQFLRITIESEEDFSDWQAGWTRFYLNTVDISHGETKDPKILGSGDAEKRRQDFQFKISEVSFIPSNAAVTGVAPDMDVTVDGIKWEFRDFGDPTAEGEDAWSVARNEDNTLQIHFRRRLPTGTNNVAVSRHRVGVGAKGTGIPSWSIAKPMKKNRFVTGIIQPFATAGGADREPVSDIRENAPSKLAANGRAVSLKDFERLCKRHSSVWQAKAREVTSPGAVDRVDVVIVPANGGAVTPTLERDLIDFVESRALPNVRVTIASYQTLALQMHVKINVDTSRYEKADVKDSTEAALVAEFALNNRTLGQPLYVAEILAAMERVEGVSSATITRFAPQSGTPAPLRKAEISGSLVAIFPTEEQVAVLLGPADVTVNVGVPA